MASLVKTNKDACPGHWPGCAGLRPWGQGHLCPPGAQVPCVLHEDAPRGPSLVHDRPERQVVLVQGDLQGLAAATEQEKGVQEPQALHEHLLREVGDALLWGEGDFQLPHFFGLQGDVVEGVQGHDLGKEGQGHTASEDGSSSALGSLLC